MQPVTQLAQLNKCCTARGQFSREDTGNLTEKLQFSFVTLKRKHIVWWDRVHFKLRFLMQHRGENVRWKGVLDSASFTMET